MKFYMYILYSGSKDRYYIGSTGDLEKRVIKHNYNHKGFTGKNDDWKVVYSEVFHSLSDARKRELYVKRMKSRKYLESLINT